MFFDLDHFKHYNDTFGHASGDEVLRVIGRLMHQESLGRDFCARYGGEEFALILPNTGSVGAWQVAERIRRTIAEYAWGNTSVTASFGAATWVSGEPQELLLRADLALYAAKSAGRNRVILQEQYEQQESAGSRFPNEKATEANSSPTTSTP